LDLNFNLITTCKTDLSSTRMGTALDDGERDINFHEKEMNHAMGHA